MEALKIFNEYNKRKGTFKTGRSRPIPIVMAACIYITLEEDYRTKHDSNEEIVITEDGGNPDL